MNGAECRLMAAKKNPWRIVVPAGPDSSRCSTPPLPITPDSSGRFLQKRQLSGVIGTTTVLEEMVDPAASNLWRTREVNRERNYNFQILRLKLHSVSLSYAH